MLLPAPRRPYRPGRRAGQRGVVLILTLFVLFITIAMVSQLSIGASVAWNSTRYRADKTRMHRAAEVVRELPEGGRVVIEDRGSKNGTFVDGQRVERRELGSSHLIKCGDLVFSFAAAGAQLPTGPVATPTVMYSGDRDPLRRSLNQMLTMA